MNILIGFFVAILLLGLALSCVGVCVFFLSEAYTAFFDRDWGTLIVAVSILLMFIGIVGACGSYTLHTLIK